jgi:hypothetical protein
MSEDRIVLDTLGKLYANGHGLLGAPYLTERYTSSNLAGSASTSADSVFRIVGSATLTRRACRIPSAPVCTSSTIQSEAAERPYIPGRMSR